VQECTVHDMCLTGSGMP